MELEKNLITRSRCGNMRITVFRVPCPVPACWMLIGSINSGASMRAIKSFTVAGVTALLVLGTVAAPAHAAPVNTTTVDGISYTADDANVPAGATVTAYDRGSGSTVTIPPSVTIGVTDYAVTTIGNGAFNFAGLRSLSLPGSLTTIGANAFLNNSLDKVSLPGSLTTIGEFAFFGNLLISVSFPNSLTTIGDFAFAENPLTEVSLPDMLTAIGGFAFYNNDLKLVSLPDSLITIGDSAFAENALESVSLPDSLTTIGDSAFANNALTSVSLPNMLTTIGDYAFDGNSLTSVSLPNTLTSIGRSAFAGNSLTSVSLPNMLTTIGRSAFAENALTSVSLPNMLTTIGRSAFAENALTSVSLPASVTTIGEGAFYGNALTSVRFLGAAPASFGESVFTSDPLVSYFWSFGAPQTAGGFTSPTWNGYRTEAIAIIRYVTDGAPAIDPAEAIVGTTLAVPTNATRDGYTFDGWYTAETGGTAWNFTTDEVAGDLTLFARYAAVPVTPTPVDPAVPATPTGTAALVLAATGVASPAVPAGIGALVLLAGITLLLLRRRRHTV
jgi:uncharacterized repeat protein (TIGR02543 family)/LPXTG-motif cell wall-anchored protein